MPRRNHHAIERIQDAGHEPTECEACGMPAHWLLPDGGCWPARRRTPARRSRRQGARRPALRRQRRHRRLLGEGRVRPLGRHGCGLLPRGGGGGARQRRRRCSSFRSRRPERFPALQAGSDRPAGAPDDLDAGPRDRPQGEVRRHPAATTARPSWCRRRARSRTVAALDGRDRLRRERHDPRRQPRRLLRRERA